MKTVIFACVHNAGRSQMAAAFFNTLKGEKDVQAISAGTNPASSVHPVVLETMKEVGIDLSTVSPSKLTAELCNGAILLITMGCGENCPYVPGLRIEDWQLKDPKALPAEEVRVIRNEIRDLVKNLIEQLEQ